ncbi:TPA: 3'-5' exonuclease [Salmonella enterica]|uniref:3'-5' exonuclease n=1 Tax=Salmonella enterica TaxID=28901 RepID=A0A743PG12_SALER|nr:3'-5' exonuclease [Salmonella enterica]
MSDDDLKARRAAALAGDKCFSQGRLRDEFRMKPAPGAEPVRWYKNGYGSKYGVYRIADCVPLREKQPRTEKQRQAGARLGLQARMKSERGKAARLAYTWLSQDPVFLDTETTGLDAGAQALEIGLVNVSGDLIYDYGPTNRYGTISLASAASQAGLNWSGRAHSAVADAVMTAGVVRDIAEYWRELQCEMNEDAGCESA